MNENADKGRNIYAANEFYLTQKIYRKKDS